jgi:hypothetical protein
MNFTHAIYVTILRDWKPEIEGLSVLFVAGVCVMPPAFPKSFQEWWTWLRDTLQTAIPAARHATVLPQETKETTTDSTKEK